MGNVLLNTQNCSSLSKMLVSEFSALILGSYCLLSVSPRAQMLDTQLLKLPPFWAGGVTTGPEHVIHLEDLLASSEVFQLSYLG